MTRAIRATKNSAPGPDKIPNETLKHLPPKGLDSLFVLHNKLWQQGYFSDDWLESTKIPISTPSKDPTNPLNYRPLTLTIIRCKVMEGMVIVRLLDFSERKGTLATLQCKGRAKRTTFDHLLSLEATIRKAQANSEQIVFIFIDMEKAQDLTLRHGILMDIHEAGMERRMFIFLQTFHKPRFFKLKFKEFLSNTKVQTEGIP